MNSQQLRESVNEKLIEAMSKNILPWRRPWSGGDNGGRHRNFATNRAYSARTVGFLAQSTYPPGIGGTQPGLFFGLQERFSIITPAAIVATNPVNGAVFTTSTNVDPNLPNGITIFPGGFPLYRNGVMIGAIGISGKRTR